MVNSSLTKQERISNRKKSLQQMVLGKLDSDIEKNKPGLPYYAKHKNKLKIDERPTRSHQYPKG